MAEVRQGYSSSHVQGEKKKICFIKMNKNFEIKVFLSLTLDWSWTCEPYCLWSQQGWMGRGIYFLKPQKKLHTMQLELCDNENIKIMCLTLLFS